MLKISVKTYLDLNKAKIQEEINRLKANAIKIKVNTVTTLKASIKGNINTK